MLKIEMRITYLKSHCSLDGALGPLVVINMELELKKHFHWKCNEILYKIDIRKLKHF